MRNPVVLLAGMVCGLVLAAQAGAGITTINFDSGTGPLSGSTFTSSGGSGCFTGAGAAWVQEGGTAVSSSGVTTITMMLQPSATGAGFGLILRDAADSSVVASAIVYSDGSVTLTGSYGQTAVDSFPFVGASNNTLTLSYNPADGRATMTLNSREPVYVYEALEGANSVNVGVASNGSGCFSNFTATGAGIPDYPPADSDGDGVTDTDEAAAGTDPHDPGWLPVHNASGATVHALNGATVGIAAGSLPSATVNVKVSTPATIPVGTMPPDYMASSAGLELETSGTIFSSPVMVTLPYTAGSVAGLEESSLTVLWFEGAGYSASGIAGVAVNTGNRTISFTTTHFTTFLIAGKLLDSDHDGTPDIYDAFPHNPYGTVDTDGDGIGDEWEMVWFGDLTTADATSDYDHDGVPDIVEFQYAYFGLDPKDGTSQLPVGEIAAGVLLGLSLAAAGLRRLRR